MLTLLSPAKSLDEHPDTGKTKHSNPLFLPQAEMLVARLKQLSPRELKSLMSISDSLAELNAERYQQWEPDFRPGENAAQAILMFKGDVYQGLQVDNWNQENFESAQSTLRILSGLYGILRPLDLIMPYRLEMGTQLGISDNKNLYQFWGDQLTNHLNKELQTDPHPWLCNLASVEYSKAVDLKNLPHPVVTPVFKDEKNGKFKIISFYAKHARGLMANFIVRNQISTPKQLQSFNAEGYQFAPEQSTPTQPTFLRKESQRP